MKKSCSCLTLSVVQRSEVTQVPLWSLPPTGPQLQIFHRSVSQSAVSSQSASGCGHTLPARCSVTSASSGHGCTIPACSRCLGLRNADGGWTTTPGLHVGLETCKHQVTDYNEVHADGNNTCGNFEDLDQHGPHKVT